MIYTVYQKIRIYNNNFINIWTKNTLQINHPYIIIGKKTNFRN